MNPKKSLFKSSSTKVSESDRNIKVLSSIREDDFEPEMYLKANLTINDINELK